MKILVNRQSLLKALQSISGVAIQRDLYPILENVRITNLENTLLLKATDLKTYISYEIPKENVQILDAGDVLINAKSLLNYVKASSEKEILIYSEWFMAQEDTQKFSKVLEFDGKGTIEISGDDFKKLIKKTLFATTSENTRYDLDNVLIDIIGDVIRFVSTDGKRLAICEKKYKAVAEVIGNRFNVPSASLKQIEKVISATKPETITLSFSESQLLFRANDVMLSTRLSEAKFPPYEKVMPKALPYKAILSTRALLEVLKKASPLTDQKNKIVEIIFTPNEVNVFSFRVKEISSHFKLPAYYDGHDISIKFNLKFLLDVLKVIDSKEVTLLIEDGQTAILLKDGDDFKYVVLPLKVEEDKDSSVKEIKESDSTLYRAYKLLRNYR